ncbi:hypothetical protein PR202_gb01781 [Eleusine coracana subsp. coracana]|uniref:Uncharacterized protein n=1 Tax=Eleusine coracana subsp. coracana TaxID=191504 RepID=A0AAV5DYA8_ELECO|nr:hypothetical protein PR202_gb01781 [Eleusine coracana subsp. coracana]
MEKVESAPDSPAQAPPSSASSLPKEQSQVELELRLLQALEFYPPSKLKGIHRHFVLYGLMEYLNKSLDRNFSSDEVLQLLDRFFNLEMLNASHATSPSATARETREGHTAGSPPPEQGSESAEGRRGKAPPVSDRKEPAPARAHDVPSRCAPATGRCGRHMGHGRFRFRSTKAHLLSPCSPPLPMRE